MKRLLCAVVCAAAGHVGAQDWQLAVSSEEVFYYVSRVERAADGGIKFWIRGEVKPGVKSVQVNPMNQKSPRYTQLMQFLKINCRDQTVATISQLYRDAQGRTVASASGSEFLMSPIVPDSVADGLREYVCQ